MSLSRKKSPADPVLAAVSRRDLTALRKALDRKNVVVSARAMGAAAAAAWKPGLAALVRAGGDLNALYRNYRPLHQLIQAEPHVEGPRATPERIACLEWMLGHGADPELLGAWPSARALVVAAFGGEAELVAVLLARGARRDAFTASALGDARGLERHLKKDPSLATARDGGLLTALQCCGGSRLGHADAKVSAGLLSCARTLVAAGADVNARTKSWSDEVNVSYFVIRSGQVEMLRFLLEHGLDATAAIPTAAWQGREDLLDLLLAAGGRIDDARDGTRPVLNDLVRWGQFRNARLLLARGASPNRPDERGWTAVHQAASRGNVAMLRELMAAGGDSRIAAADGVLPRDLARGRARKDLLALLS